MNERRAFLKTIAGIAALLVIAAPAMTPLWPKGQIFLFDPARIDISHIESLPYELVPDSLWIPFFPRHQDPVIIAIKPCDRDYVEGLIRELGAEHRIAS